MKDLQGSKLFDNASEFYTWYMMLVSKPRDQAEVFQTLSQLMRVAEISRAGGNYLSETEETTASQALCALREQLLDGKIKQHDILSRVQSIREKLIFHNPKAKLVTYATEVEYKFYLSPSPRLQADYVKKMIDSLLTHVNPSLQPINAQAISQVLVSLLETVSGSGPLENTNSQNFLERTQSNLDALLNKG